MELSTIVSSALIVAGMGVMTGAAVVTSRVLAQLRAREQARRWQRLRALELFFLGGYAAALLALIVGQTSLLVSLCGVVFLFGALFVLLVARVSSATYHELERVSVRRDLYERTLDAIEQPLIVIRTDGEITDCNEQLVGWLGFEREQLVGANATKVLEMTPGLLQSFLAAEEHVRTRSVLRTSWGTSIPVELSRTALAGTRLRVCTAREIAVASEGEAEKGPPREELARRNGLRLLRTELEAVLLRRAAGDDALAVDRALARVLDALGRRARSDEKSRRPALTTISVRALVDELVASLERWAEARGVRLEAALDEDVPESLTCSEAPLFHALFALVVDTISRASPRQLQLRVSARGQVAPEVSFRIISRLRAADVSAASGLWSVSPGFDMRVASREHITAIGGTLSTHVSTGTLTVTLSITDAAARQASDGELPGEGTPESESGAETSESQRVWSAASGSARDGVDDASQILVVDDTLINRKLLNEFLQKKGHSVTLSSGGRDAIARLKERRFDLVLLDLMMPDVDGYEVLSWIRADHEDPDLPVVMVSALDDIDNVARCVEAGADDYLPKPISPALLHARVEACLEKQRRNRRERHYRQRLEDVSARADRLLRVLLPDPIVEEYIENNTIRPRRRDEVAVMFVDVVGFTAYCDRHPPEEVLTRLQRMVSEFERLARRHGVQKLKTIGDSFMAAAGLLQPAENPALRCVNLGRDIIAAMHELAPDWSVRIGVHVGPVIAGIVGTRHFQFDIWGDTVNTAQRVEHHGVPGAICVSDPAWRRISAHFDGERRGAQAKGKGELVSWRVVKPKERRATSPAGSASASAR